MNCVVPIIVPNIIIILLVIHIYIYISIIVYFIIVDNYDIIDIKEVRGTSLISMIS